MLTDGVDSLPMDSGKKITEGSEMKTNTKQSLRIAQVVEWDRSGQSSIALIRGTEIIGRFADYATARAAMKIAKIV